MGFKRPLVQIQSLGPKEKHRKPLITAASGAFFMPCEKTAKNRQKQRYCYSGRHPFLELVRELPKVVQLHVLVVPQLLAGGVADQLDLVFLAAGGPFE